MIAHFQSSFSSQRLCKRQGDDHDDRNDDNEDNDDDRNDDNEGHDDRENLAAAKTALCCSSLSALILATCKTR